MGLDFGKFKIIVKLTGCWFAAKEKAFFASESKKLSFGSQQTLLQPMLMEVYCSKAQGGYHTYLYAILAPGVGAKKKFAGNFI
jgi:hypothetical protein